MKSVSPQMAVLPLCFCKAQARPSLASTAILPALRWALQSWGAPRRGLPGTGGLSKLEELQARTRGNLLRGSYSWGVALARTSEPKGDRGRY